MAIATRRSPQAFSITLGAAASQNNLFTLLVAGNGGVLQMAQVVRIQLDPDAGAAQLYCGNPDSTVSATNCGASLLAGQVWDLPSVGKNLYYLSDIVLASDTASVQVNVTVVSRYCDEN